MKKILFLPVLLSLYGLSGFTQPVSQTRTANLYNCWGEAFLDLWAKGSAALFAADDGAFAYSKKLSAGRSVLQLQLHDFRFDIPSGATIENITITARRFKTGRGAIKDYYATLIKKRDGTGFSSYGVRLADPNNYPDTETEVLYAQSGAGTNGGSPSNYYSYQWTPEMINDTAFGLRIATYEPVGGSLVVYYDLVNITVTYIPATTSRTSTGVTEARLLKVPVVYPNPFSSKATIQFTASENGKAIVELFDAAGIKLSTLFSAPVLQGQVYRVEVGGASLPKGMYVYKVSNGKQKQSGRIIKLE